MSGDGDVVLVLESVFGVAAFSGLLLLAFIMVMNWRDRRKR